MLRVWDHVAHGSEKAHGWSRNRRTQPGKLLLDGDSHTATTELSERRLWTISEAVYTAHPWQVKPKKMLVEFTGVPSKWVFILSDCLALIAIRRCLWCRLCVRVNTWYWQWKREWPSAICPSSLAPRWELWTGSNSPWLISRGRECVPEDFEGGYCWLEARLSAMRDAVYKVIQMDVSDLAPMALWVILLSGRWLWQQLSPRNYDMNDESELYHYMNLEPGQKPAWILN